MILKFDPILLLVVIIVVISLTTYRTTIARASYAVHIFVGNNYWTYTRHPSALHLTTNLPIMYCSNVTLIRAGFKNHTLYMDSTYRESVSDVTDGHIGTVLDHRIWHWLHREGIFSLPDQSYYKLLSGKLTDGAHRNNRRSIGVWSWGSLGSIGDICWICQIVSKSVISVVTLP